jgi:hypothetical protein
MKDTAALSSLLTVAAIGLIGSEGGRRLDSSSPPVDRAVEASPLIADRLTSLARG